MKEENRVISLRTDREGELFVTILIADRYWVVGGATCSPLENCENARVMKVRLFKGKNEEEQRRWRSRRPIRFPVFWLTRPCEYSD